MTSITCKCKESKMHEVHFNCKLMQSYYHYLVWFVNDSIQPDHIRVVELPHNGCLFEQFVPTLFYLPMEGLDSHLKWSLKGAHPLSLVDHPKLPLPQLLQKGDAFRLQIKVLFSFLTHLVLDSIDGGSWCPVQAFLFFLAAFEHCILLQRIIIVVNGTVNMYK